MRHTTGILHSPTGRAIVERAHQTLKRLLHQQQGGPEVKTPIERLCKALFTINFLNNSFEKPVPPVFWHFTNLAQSKLKEQPPVLVKDPETHQIQGPFPLVVWGRGYACVSTPKVPKWVPACNIKLYRPIDKRFQDLAPGTAPRTSSTSSTKGEVAWKWRKKKDTTVCPRKKTSGEESDEED